MDSEWRITSVGDVCEAIYDGPHATPKKTNEGPIFLGISDLQNGQINLSDAEHLSEEDFIKWTRRVTPRQDDIVFSYETRLGEAALVPKGLKFCLGRRMALMRPNTSKVVPRFLLYAYLGPEFQQTLRAHTVRGSTVDRIPLIGFPSFPISLPPLPEQRAIAGILGALDDKIEVNRRMNGTLESMARAVFRQFVEDDETKKWEIGKAKDLCIRVENGGTPRRDKPEFWEPGTIPWLTSGEVRQNIVTLTENKISELGYENSSAKLWQSGTTIVALYGATAGEVSFIAQELCANQACCGLIPKPEAKYFLYLALSFSVENLALLSRGSAQQNLSQQIVADFPIVVPDSKSLEKFNNIVEPLFDKWILNLKESRTLASLRDSLLPRLMRGDVRVGVT